MNFLFESVTKPDACYLQAITIFSKLFQEFTKQKERTYEKRDIQKNGI